MPKMHQNTFGGRWGSLSAPLEPVAAIEGVLLLREGREGKGCGLTLSPGSASVSIAMAVNMDAIVAQHNIRFSSFLS